MHAKRVCSHSSLENQIFYLDLYARRILFIIKSGHCGVVDIWGPYLHVSERLFEAVISFGL
jgi:hypothetical protein